MPIYELGELPVFPDPEEAEADGIIAVGGDLSPIRLLNAYYNGIFPWYGEGQPILWWSPDPRFILYPKDIRISSSMKKFIRRNSYNVTFDTAFREVINHCAKARSDGTWITEEMLDAYCLLHTLGYAHSVETWHEGKLVGGLYGVSIGLCFFGESMFSLMDNASKLALIELCDFLSGKGFMFVDCQVYTKHLESMGAVMIGRKEFLNLLEKGTNENTTRGTWVNVKK